MVKHFTPLECNPEVFNKLIYSLGVTKAVSFYDVWSIDEPELLAMIPRPVYALIMTFPISDKYEDYRKTQDHDLQDDYYSDISGDSSKEKVLWFKQTIGNACGTMAALHAVANAIPKDTITAGSELEKFLNQAKPLNVSERCHLLENSDAIEASHGAVGTLGNTQAPDARDNIDFHYVCICRNQQDGHLYELDGRRKGPIDLGSLNDGDDALSDKALTVVKQYLQREGESGAFSIIALAQAWDD